MDWQLTCRVCLEMGEMVSIFDCDENNQQLCEKYAYCCGVEITKDDSLPTLICLNCVDRLTLCYQFKQQCIASNETLKDCLEEFLKSSAEISENSKVSKEPEIEIVTIKQENGILLQYELPIEQEPQKQWTRTLSKTIEKTVENNPVPKKTGCRKKNLNEQDHIDLSPHTRKLPTESSPEPEYLTTEYTSDILDLKEEPKEEAFDDDEPFQLVEEDFPDDPDFVPESDEEEDFSPSKHIEPEVKLPKKRGRPRKSSENIQKAQKKRKCNDDGEDILLKETIMAISEPIPDDILNPKPKKKYPSSKKKYSYEKLHICETCGSSFTSKASLQAHIRRHLGIKPFVCSVCGYASPYKKNLTLHMNRHTGRKPYKCHHCDRRFYDIPDRIRHESVCPYTTNYPLCLKRHMLRHTGTRPYACQYCTRRFFDWGDRAKHERLHSGERPYQCNICGKSFTYSFVLANHMLTHTGEKKYSCDMCKKKFTKAHHLKHHNKIHHKELYLKEQKEAEAYKMKRHVQQINVADVTGALSGRIVDGELQLEHVTKDGEDNEVGEQIHIYIADNDGGIHEQDSNVMETEGGGTNMPIIEMGNGNCEVTINYE